MRGRRVLMGVFAVGVRGHRMFLRIFVFAHLVMVRGLKMVMRGRVMMRGGVVMMLDRGMLDACGHGSLLVQEIKGVTEHRNCTIVANDEQALFVGILVSNHRMLMRVFAVSARGLGVLLRLVVLAHFVMVGGFQVMMRGGEVMPGGEVMMLGLRVCRGNGHDAFSCCFEESEVPACRLEHAEAAFRAE